MAGLMYWASVAFLLVALLLLWLRSAAVRPMVSPEQQPETLLEPAPTSDEPKSDEPQTGQPAETERQPQQAQVLGQPAIDPRFRPVHVGSPVRVETLLRQRRKSLAKPGRGHRMGCCGCSSGSAADTTNRSTVLISAPTDPSDHATEPLGDDAGVDKDSSCNGDMTERYVNPKHSADACSTAGLEQEQTASAQSDSQFGVPVVGSRPWLAGIAQEERRKLDEMRSEGFALLATAHPDDPLLCPSREADRDGVLLRYLRARKTISGALEQLQRGIAWRRAMKVHEWHCPAIVSARGILADPCSQVYCCDSGYRDRRGRPYMVGAIELFDSPTHDPDKHLFAIYYVLERLVVNFRWPECPNFCYVLDLAPPPDPPRIHFDVPCEVPRPKHGRMEGLNTLRRGLGVAQMAYPEVCVAYFYA